MNDLNDHLVDHKQNSGTAAEVVITSLVAAGPTACNEDISEYEFVQAAPHCSNGVCSLDWKPMRPAA